ncbi:hypothetical protein, partial [Actinotalea sp. C106]|uniref:hypothetical protein n=1 Tax=Actinotalea sp. C106 TaxID=2908644 RepID=UPI0020284CF0
MSEQSSAEWGERRRRREQERLRGLAAEQRDDLAPAQTTSGQTPGADDGAARPLSRRELRERG